MHAVDEIVADVAEAVAVASRALMVQKVLQQKTQQKIQKIQTKNPPMAQHTAVAVAAAQLVKA